MLVSDPNLLILSEQNKCQQISEGTQRWMENVLLGISKSCSLRGSNIHLPSRFSAVFQWGTSSSSEAQIHKPGSGELHQEHRWDAAGQGARCQLAHAAHSQILSFFTATAIRAQQPIAVRTHSPAPWILVVFVKGEIASLGTG